MIRSVVASAGMALGAAALACSNHDEARFGQSLVHHERGQNGHPVSVLQLTLKGRPYGAAIVSKTRNIYVGSKITKSDTATCDVCVDNTNGLLYLANETIDLREHRGLVRVDEHGRRIAWYDGKNAESEMQGFEVVEAEPATN
ncbi:MAG: hypothetical protein VX246_02335 [Myxococcota bacterium]|nr:hypothetical protein [Myxococcota bacterium]